MLRHPQRVKAGILGDQHLLFQIPQVFAGIVVRFVFQRDEQTDFYSNDSGYDAGGRSTMNALPP